MNRLLKEGEREAVVEFLEAFARLTFTERDCLVIDAQAIREGRMPGRLTSIWSLVRGNEGPPEALDYGLFTSNPLNARALWPPDVASISMR